MFSNFGYYQKDADGFTMLQPTGKNIFFAPNKISQVAHWDYIIELTSISVFLDDLPAKSINLFILNTL